MASRQALRVVDPFLLRRERSGAASPGGKLSLPCQRALLQILRSTIQALNITPPLPPILKILPLHV